MTWTIVYSKQAVKDARKLAASNLKRAAAELIETLKEDPFKTPPPYERLVYEVFEKEKIVRVLRMWTHYE